MKQCAKIPIYSISVPDYHVKTQPDYARIGEKIDLIFKKHFIGQRVAIRCIGSEEHKGKTVDELIKIIKKIGTDRYDPNREGDRYENVHNKKIDFFALDFKVRKNSMIMEKFIEPFYVWPKGVGKKPVRLDLALVYDREKVKMVLHTYGGKRIKRDGFTFKDSDNKAASIKGIIKIK
ncbi:MAG: hypothetical protein CO002_02255 [Candidatus Portnoybacteria bacterium CG_4_8_14_3_um_filter_44_10]|uniref:Uncharacterized protein n=4 Tax=Candidatus Portnoyibacteriota TaxID=1817913 RepID=A0A2H0KQM1_9BACT|nr:MAG: hypothetical protein COV85_02060 [Candidatus Portnoybacteria bacterium CG11_big_fil_rev_8_21_14_0_20_44_10]PIS16476.1 MAG: hypothetical protein COT61_03755 [Candidatus Portnoybacteria bacterium CG09_land_8_20_14_0_10_44_13]PIW75401.1 MAG: hypothetical protein CO002_02255 [Candidatus Portnoybacteria bacterium CG_4_8_14_3_um_filter_44_10]PIZ71638.1 MAG: hypothetical protein COY11_01055 [Candidatus Portnoybacteria bacterium CG_4_10_14_0_2_um_filter_44_20]